MKTHMTELNMNEMEMVNGGSVLSTLMHVAGGLAATAVGSVAGPVGAIGAGLAYVATEIAVNSTTSV